MAIAVDCSTRDVFLSNQISNISKGGLFLRSERPLPLSAEVRLDISLPETGARIRVRGRVVWNYDMQRGTSCICRGSGIRFLDMSEGDRHALESYLERLARPTQG